MILPDVNVLIYAFRADAVKHELCEKWLLQVVSGPSPFAISPLTLSALVHITTNNRSFKTPSTLQEAFTFCDFLLDRPNCQVVEPGRRHWEIFKELSSATRLTGPAVTDTWYAALAIEWACEWITFDRDYARFPGLKLSEPSLRT